MFLVDSHHPEPLAGHTQERVLNDGRRVELTDAAAGLGWALDVRVTRHGAILYASGKTRP